MLHVTQSSKFTYHTSSSSFECHMSDQVQSSRAWNKFFLHVAYRMSEHFQRWMSHVTPSSKLTSQTKFKVHMHGTNDFCMLHIARRKIFKDGCRMSQDFERCMSQVVIFFKFFLQLPKTSYSIFPKISFCMLHQV